MKLNLKDKVVVITGGATGIGFEAAFEFLREGCKVAICGRRQEKLDEAAALFAKEGFSVLARSVDVCDYAAFEAFGEEVHNTFGKIDIWLNNAAGNTIRSLVDFSVDEFCQLMDLNLTSVFVGCKIAYRYMKGKGGVILNGSSFSALDPNAGRGVYSTAKAGILSLTSLFAAELAPDNIRVIAYVPGMIETPISERSRALYKDALLADIPMRRFGKPDEVAKLLVFLASDAASYINGTHITIAGGKRCVQNPHYAFNL